MNATTNLNVEEDLSLKDNALLFKTDATTNLNMTEDLSWLIWFVEVTGTHTNDAKVLHETLVVKVTDSRTNNVKTLHETFIDEVTGSHANNVKILHETFFDEITCSHNNNVKTLNETFFDEVTDSTILALLSIEGTGMSVGAILLAITIFHILRFRQGNKLIV